MSKWHVVAVVGVFVAVTGFAKGPDAPEVQGAQGAAVAGDVDEASLYSEIVKTYVGRGMNPQKADAAVANLRRSYGKLSPEQREVMLKQFLRSLKERR